MTSINLSGILYIKEDTGNILYSNDNISWTNILEWPVIITNTDAPNSTLIIKFTTNLTFTDVNNYFICNSSHIQFGDTSLNPDGSRPTININIIGQLYTGLIRNGGVLTPCFSNIVICNIIISLSGTGLDQFTGWITQRYYGNNSINNIIINCSSYGNINFNSGGICGPNAASNGGNLTIIGCTSSGIIGLSSGGICGPFAASNGGYLLINGCSSTGIINSSGGGIIGRFGADTNGEIHIINCYSTGIHQAQFSGSICGATSGINNGNIITSYCYSIGNILNRCGGIIGSFSNNTQTVKCFSTGNIEDPDGGGIFSTAYTTLSQATNCYTSGSSTISTGGIYASSNQDNIQGNDNYSETNNNASGWNYNNATTTLEEVPNPVSQNWINIGINQPFRLRNIGFSPYSLNNITSTYTLNTTYSQTITQGNSTIASILPDGYTYTIIAINNTYPSTYPTITINAATGQISTDISTLPGIYNIIVQNEINPYSISEFILDVRSIPESSPLLLCCNENKCIRNSITSDKDNELYIENKSGKTLLSNTDSYYNAINNGKSSYFLDPVFKTYTDYIQYIRSKAI